MSRSYTRVLGWTVLGAAVPGLGLLGTRRRRLGVLVLVIWALLVGGVIWLATSGRREALRILVHPDALSVLAVGIAVLGLGWVAVIVATHRSLTSAHTPLALRITGSVLVAVLAFVVTAPTATGVWYALIQRDLLQSLFASGQDAHDGQDLGQVWEGRRRINILLLGGDAGPGRVGTRTDTVLVASVDVKNGKTVLFSLPRNLEKVPFPPGSALAQAYPDGIYDGPGSRLEWMLTSMYENVPAQHPELLHGKDPGAEALMQAVGEVLGLRLDYYVLIDLEGFVELIEAVGGITVNVNERVPIGGSDERPPSRWIEPGPDKHLWGYEAMWFARGRYGSDDYARMARQRCAIKAIVEQANPFELLRRYQAIAQTSKKMVRTDIPSEHLAALVELSMLVRKAGIQSVVFDNKVIRSSDPDYDLIRSKVQAALRPSTPTPKASGGRTGSKTTQPAPDICAYHPER